MNAFAAIDNPDFLTFRDLDDHRTIVIHAGAKASSKASARQMYQDSHNIAVKATNPIDPEDEPRQSLYVSLKDIATGKYYSMVDPVITRKVIIHGDLSADHLIPIVIEIMSKAPDVDIYLGKFGVNAEERNDLKEIARATAEATNVDEPVKSKFKLVSGFEGFDTKASYLIKGLLPAESTVAIYGPPSSFKSFLAVSMGCHVATGSSWDGRRVEKGAVLYIVGEGGIGVPRRIRAWCIQYNGGKDVSNFYRIQMPVFMANEVDVAHLELAARQVKEETGLPIRLIVVDTVARCFGGADENRAADMGAFISGCDQIKDRTKATVLLVHHTGKDEAAGARGSSSFKAAMDVELFVKREGEGEAVTLTCTKMKDDEAPTKRAYDLSSREVTRDEDDDPVTSLVLLAAGREPAESDELDDVGNLTSNHIALFQAVRAVSERQGGIARRRCVIDYMKQAGTWNSSNGGKWFRKLIDEKKIGFNKEEDTVWIITKGTAKEYGE